MVVIGADHRKVFTWHCAAIAAFVAGHVFVVAMAHLGHGQLMGLSERLNMTEEAAFATFFAALALAGCALVAGLLAKATMIPREQRGWALLSLGFLFLAFDEACGIHELFDQLATGLSGPFYYAWVIPYGLAIPVVLFGLFPFWRRLPSASRQGLSLGAAVFIGAALGMELVEGTIVSHAGDEIYDASGMMLFLLIEEGGEMLGVAILLRTLVAHMMGATGPEASGAQLPRGS